MKRLPNTEFQKYIGRTTFTATLYLLDCEKIKEGTFRIEKQVVTDVQLFQNRNGEVEGKVFLNGDSFFSDYMPLERIRRFLHGIFQTHTNWTKMEERYDWPAEEYAQIEGEWMPQEDEQEQTDRIYQHCVNIARDAYKKEAAKIDERIAELQNGKKKLLMK